MSARIIERKYHGNGLGIGWRETIYEAPDGARLSVAVPPRAWLGSDGNPERFDFDEDGEARMLASLLVKHPGATTRGPKRRDVALTVEVPGE